MNILNVNYDAFSCYSTTPFDYVDTLILTTLVPPLITLIMFILYYLESLYITYKQQGKQYIYDSWTRSVSTTNFLLSKPDPSLEYCLRFIRALIVFSEHEKSDALGDAKEAFKEEDIPVGTVEVIEKLSQIGEKNLVSITDVECLIRSEMAKNRVEWKVWDSLKRLGLSNDAPVTHDEDLLIPFIQAWKSRNLDICISITESFACKRGEAVQNEVEMLQMVSEIDDMHKQTNDMNVNRQEIVYLVLLKCCTTLSEKIDANDDDDDDDDKLVLTPITDVMKKFIEEQLERLEMEVTIFEQLVDASVLSKERENLCKYIRERFITELVSKLEPELKEAKLQKLLEITRINDEMEHYTILKEMMEMFEIPTVAVVKDTTNVKSKNKSKKKTEKTKMNEEEVESKVIKLEAVEKTIAHKLSSLSTSDTVVGNRNTTQFILKELSILTTKQEIFTLRGRYVTLFLFMTYAILTTVSVTIGEAFGTIDINPGAAVYSNSNYYLS